MTTEHALITEAARPFTITNEDTHGAEPLLRDASEQIPSGSLDDWTQLEGEQFRLAGVYLNGHTRSLIEQRHQRARANALMDSACLFLLEKFGERQYIDINDLGLVIAGPLGWLKVCLLVRADFVEIIGSDLRITQEGVQSLADAKTIASS